MNNLLIRCAKCGTVYRIIKTDRENQCLITDFGDKIKIDSDTAICNCMKCNNQIELLDNSIVTESWIADLIFKVKGN